MVMLYNKTLFEENNWKVPTTLEELEDVAGKIKAKGMNVFSYGSDGWQPTHEHLVGIYLNNYAGPQAVYEAIIGEREWDIGLPIMANLVFFMFYNYLGTP